MVQRTRVRAVEVGRSVLKVEFTNLDMGFAIKREVKVDSWVLAWAIFNVLLGLTKAS